MPIYTVTVAKTRTRTAQSEDERANHKALTGLGGGGNLKIERTQKMICDCTEEHKSCVNHSAAHVIANRRILPNSMNDLSLNPRHFSTTIPFEFTDVSR